MMRAALAAAFLLIVPTIGLAADSGSAGAWNPGQEETGQPDRRLPSGLNRPRITTRGQLEIFIFQEMQENHIPGLSASIMKEGEIIWKDTFGYADLYSSTLPQVVQESTLFMQASVSKTVTAVAIMQLWEQGLFELDDPVNLYLPHFWVASPHHPFEPITIRMLMTHTSGIDDNWSVMPIYPGDSPIPLGEYLESYLTPGGSLYDPDLNFCTWKPGTDYEYSNIGTSLAGYLVETISGMELDRYCRKYIFKPLRMRESSFFLAKLDPSQIAVPYFWNGSEFVSYGHYGRSHYPAGQLRTSVPQLGNFLQTFMDCRKLGRRPVQDSVRLLERETVELMLTPQVPHINGSIGLIWNRVTAPDGTRLWGHIGGFYGVRTSMRYGPENDIGIVLMTNGEGDKEDIFRAMYDYAVNHD
jgi:CubicO group peptidase (beta-lactamase class C family)